MSSQKSPNTREPSLDDQLEKTVKVQIIRPAAIPAIQAVEQIKMESVKNPRKRTRRILSSKQKEADRPN